MRRTAVAGLHTVTQVEPCSDCGSTSPFHRRHPVTDREIDYQRSCSTCRHFSTKGSKESTVHRCAKAGVIALPGQHPPAFPGCLLWR